MYFLLDNNIQIYRTVTSWWKKKNCDEIFNSIEPISTDYVLMEYRKTVIDTIHLIVKWVNEIPEASNENEIKIRLGEILEHFSSPGYYTSRRKIDLIIGITGYFINENPSYLLGLYKNEFIEALEYWAEELEMHSFYKFIKNGQHKNIQNDNLFYNLFACPLSQKNQKTTCRKGENICNIGDILNSSFFNDLYSIVINNEIDVYDNLIELQNFMKDIPNNGKSIGQKKCFKISDILHATTCMIAESGIENKRQKPE